MHGNRYGDAADTTRRHVTDPRDAAFADRTAWVGADETARVGPVDETARVGPVDDATRVGPVDNTVRAWPIDDTAEITVVDDTAEIRAVDDTAEITVPDPAALTRRIAAGHDTQRGERAVPAQYTERDPATFSVRIGKGVAAAGRSGRPRYVGGASRRWRGRTIRILSGLATIVLVGAAAWTGWQWWQRLHNRVEVANVTVAPIPQPGAGCDVQYDIVGTLTTNGQAGTISYEWLRSDGQETGTLEQSVAAGQTRTTVHLYWRFTGEGSMTATATLRVLDPTRAEGAAQFRYSCP